MAVIPDGSRQETQFPDHKATTQHQPAPAALLTQRQQYQRRYRQTHRSEIAATRRARYKQNPARFLLAAKQWVEKNRERRRAYQHAWYLKECN